MARQEVKEFSKRMTRRVWRTWPALAALVLALVAALAVPGRGLRAQGDESAPKTPPSTRTDNVKEVLHGVEITDPYRWLEDQDAPETRAWIDTQNAYTNSLISQIPGREQLRQRVAALLKVDSIGLPTERNGRYFFSKRGAEQDQSQIYMRQGPRGKDELLVDPLPMSPDHTITVGVRGVSKDGKLLVYAIRKGGEDETALRVMDVDARKELPDQLPRARYFSALLLPDKSGLYYVKMTPAGGRVFYHKLGTEVAADAEVFGKDYGPDKILVAGLSEDGRHLVIIVLYGSAADKTEVYVQDIANKGPITPIVNDLASRFFPDVAGDTMFLHTNWKAPKNRILAVDLKNPARDHWSEVVPESDAVIENMDLVGGKLVVTYTQNASSRVKVFEPGGKFVRDVALPAIGSVSGFAGRWDSSEAFYSFNSFHIPTTIYRNDLAKGTQEVWGRVQVPIESDKYEVRQVWYASKDGTKIPMFLVYAKGIKLDGSNPTLLTGYGGFNLSELPAFSTRAAAWIMSGGVYALPNLRGGGEFGEEWHRAGMQGKKQNVFDDFIAAAEWLIQNKYTRPSRLAIFGGSNGGLLVGAALTQRPELYGAVICAYPLLDMVRYHKFLVARWWVPEYGSSDDPEQFKYIYAYSPYHHVKPGTKYPAVLLTSGDSDTRVAPLHARKMAALLQAANASNNPILLHYDTKAGHSGGTPVSKLVDENTDQLSFLFWRLGVTPAGSGQ